MNACIPSLNPVEVVITNDSVCIEVSAESYPPDMPDPFLPTLAPLFNAPSDVPLVSEAPSSLNIPL
jgi:hypothetical protein